MTKQKSAAIRAAEILWRDRAPIFSSANEAKIFYASREQLARDLRRMDRRYREMEKAIVAVKDGVFSADASIKAYTAVLKLAARIQKERAGK